MFSILRPFLFNIDPETAHDLAIKSLKFNPLPSKMFEVEDEQMLKVQLLGKNFPNPIGLAAGFDKSAEAYNSLLRLGFGFVEVGTVTPLKQFGNPKPRIFRLKDDDALINRLGFNNDGSAKDEFTGSLPSPSSGSFGGAVGTNLCSFAGGNKYYQNINSTNTQGVVGTDYANAIALLANTDNYQYNVISAPGIYYQDYSTQCTSLINNTITRGDAIYVMDLVRYNQAIGTVTVQASGIDSSYTATYWPWLQTVDPNTAQLVYIPPSTMIPGVFAFTDASSDPWFAPAGITRGGLGQVVRAERKLTSTNRDTLYEANVNPIATFPQQGVVVFGQKTLQKAASALDRVNVRRLLIALKDYISQIADNLVFEQNTIATRQNFLTQVNPYLESVQQRQGLYAFKVVMDESNNTPDVVDRNILYGQIFLQPTRTAEFVVLDFTVQPTGATFPE